MLMTRAKMMLRDMICQKQDNRDSYLTPLIHEEIIIYSAKVANGRDTFLYFIVGKYLFCV